MTKYDKIKIRKMMKISSYSHKIGHFTNDFRVFSYIVWVFFEKKIITRTMKLCEIKILWKIIDFMKSDESWMVIHLALADVRGHSRSVG